MSRKNRIPGITISQRGRTWQYRVDAGTDPLTGDRNRVNKGGFATETEALEAALEAKRRHESGRAANAKRARVSDYFNEWLSAVEGELKETTAQNYRDNIDAYIVPILGRRWLGDLTVPTLNSFYKHLREQGRRKGNANARMFAYWEERQEERAGLGPKPADIAKACNTTLDAAREAVRRYRRGRVPRDFSTGLSPKSVRNVHVVMRRALADAVRWGYLHTNPAEHAVIPRAASRSSKQKTSEVWTVEQLARFLKVAVEDRYGGMWVLASTTGMRRSELAGVERHTLDLDEGFHRIGGTRVVVGGRSRTSDGKSDASDRPVALDSFTVLHLRRFVDLIDSERLALGREYPTHDYLMVGPEGRPLHPDTITARFNRLVDKAGVPRIRLHDVRHTYATMALDEDLNVKTLSERIGHADVGVTLKIYTHKSPGKDRPLADHMGSLIKAAVDALDGPPGSPDFSAERLDSERPQGA